MLDTGRRAPLALSLLALLRRVSSGSSMSRETCIRDPGKMAGVPSAAGIVRGKFDRVDSVN